jgi:hypothetical protein
MQQDAEIRFMPLYIKVKYILDIFVFINTKEIEKRFREIVMAIDEYYFIKFRVAVLN